MQTHSEPVRQDIVLVGGGHSHVDVLKRFGMKPEPGVRLTLIARDLLTPYSGMVPGLIAQLYTNAECHIDLRPLAAFAGARLIHAPATGLDLANNLVRVVGRPPVRFDLLSLDTGSTPSTAGIDGAEHALPVKPIDRFLAEQAEMVTAIAAKADRYNIVVVGGGAGGVELTLSLDQQLRRDVASLVHNPDDLSLTIIEAADSLLPSYNQAARRRLLHTIADRNIAVHTNTKIEQIDTDSVTLNTGETLPTDRTILVTNGGAPKWLAESGMALDERGFVRVGDNLRSPSHDNVYAAGDLASMDNYTLPKSGVYAVRQGPYLAENLRRAALGQPLKPYRPQKQTLALITTGDRHAIAARGSLSIAGSWVWRWKDWIDRRWMAKYQELPDMTAQGSNAGDSDVLDDMRCGGCGAKVPAPILHRALDRLPAQTKDGLAQGLEAPDDAAVLMPPPGKALVQTVDQFRAFIDDPYLFARIAANHCLGDIFAMGAEPHSALAAVMLPHDGEDKIAEDLYQLLAGATETLSEAGAVLAGGHTGEGAEMAFGLTVNGYADPDTLLRKGGLKPGDTLILTKRLGTGVLFAADMRTKAQGEWIEAAFASMLRSAGPSVPILRAHGATACTDVTGFGLLGHLIEMLQASGADATLDLDAIPLLDGAAGLSVDGIESTLKPDNEAAAAPYHNSADHIAYPLLFDPQTAGGLLFGVPQDQADACLAALRHAAAPDAAIIGQVNERRGGDPLVTLG
ncbi:MAG: selenide, water dikinase SelD [Alphaproteobacteria bacterium]|nr:selenide, water dikinase SelD [Alphaproteobacteria bacterium]